MHERWQSTCGRMELRLGDYREALADVQADHCITDPPYSARVHVGSDGLTSYDGSKRAALEYGGWNAGDVLRVVEAVRPSGWWVAITDHALAPTWERLWEAQDLYTFAPLPWVAVGSRVRLQGDGPSSWTCWVCVARPRERRMSTWGTLPGAYITSGRTQDAVVTGAKPLDLMRAIVRDYSRPGDLIVDPCAGGGTTLLAAAIEGRRAVGAELDPETFAKAVERLSKPYTPAMMPELELDAEQPPLI